MNRTIVVTGGASGIGRAITDLFHDYGDHIWICSRSKPKNIKSEKIHHVSMDVRNQRSVQQLGQLAAQKSKKIDVWINAAGVSEWKPLASVTEKFFDDIYETNVKGTFWGCQTSAAYMKNGGAIVNISSLAGKRGSANNSVYCASKFSVNGITQALAKELGPKQIRVNAVCPVYVETQYILNSLKDKNAPSQGKSVVSYLKNFANTQTALGRLPTAAEIAEVVFFLASSSASAMTGQCINVDCGTLPQ
ncbi:MAG: SDR family NAD(P)-dependent oxidoreductase [Elusimicrobiota bacterium]